MSLVVWLPLTKDTRNQGLNGIPITFTGTINPNDNGKLGKCYKTSNTGVIDLKYAGTQINTGSISLCGWFKFNKSELAATWSGYSFDSTHPYPTGNLIGNNSYGGVGLIWYTNSLASGANFTSLYAACSIRSTANGARITNAVTIPFDTWVHLALIFNKTTKALELWMNGELKVTSTMLDFNDAKADNLKLNYSAIWGGNGPSYSIPFYVNDVRIYDHCLSLMEVKELAKGLVLHYPLNRQGWGQENLLKGTDILEITNNINTGVGGWDGISSLTATSDGVKLNGRSGAPCIGLPLATVGSINNNEDYTLSFKYRTNKAVGMNFYYIESSGSNISIYNSEATEISTTEWKDYRWTINSSTVADRNPRAILLFYAFSSSSSDWVEIKKGSVKLEKGSVATPWCPNSSDALATTMGLNGTTEYDCSGFCNNGTRTGTFTWTSDTPKYSVSTAFSGSQYITEDNEIETTDSTIVAWVKTSLSANAFILDCRNSSGAGKQPIYQYTNGSIQTGGASQYVTTNTGLLVANTWIHLAIVQSGSSLLVYKNGSLFQTLSCTNSPIIKPTVGARYSLSGLLPSGNISDVRIYATALSADDVKSLYQNCATVDPDGTIRGQIRS